MLKLLLFGFLLCSSILAAHDKRDEAISLVQKGAELWTLDSLPEPNYRLKIKVVLKELQTGDLTGVHIKQRSKDQMRVETAIGAYRSTYIQDGRKAWRYKSADLPFRVMEALQTLTPKTFIKPPKDLTIEKREKKVKGEKLLCVHAGRRFGNSQQWCLDPLSNLLRWYVEEGFWAFEYSDYQPFKEKQYPRTIRAYEFDRLVAELRVEELSAIPPTVDEFIASKGMEPAPATLGCDVEDVSTNLVKKVTPEYPKFSRMNGRQGPAIFYAIIRKDGMIRELTTIFSPDAEIEKSARDAIQKWQYKPFIICGEATEVETTITIHFSLSG